MTSLRSVTLLISRKGLLQVYSFMNFYAYSYSLYQSMVMPIMYVCFVAVEINWLICDWNRVYLRNACSQGAMLWHDKRVKPINIYLPSLHDFYLSNTYTAKYCATKRRNCSLFRIIKVRILRPCFKELHLQFSQICLNVPSRRKKKDIEYLFRLQLPQTCLNVSSRENEDCE